MTKAFSDGLGAGKTFAPQPVDLLRININEAFRELHSRICTQLSEAFLSETQGNFLITCNYDGADLSAFYRFSDQNYVFTISIEDGALVLYDLKNGHLVALWIGNDTNTLIKDSFCHEIQYYITRTTEAAA